MKPHSKKVTHINIPRYIEDFFRNNKVWEKFSEMSNSHKKEYVEWISEAKKEETKIRRLQKAVTQIALGKGSFS